MLRVGIGADGSVPGKHREGNRRGVVVPPRDGNDRGQPVSIVPAAALAAVAGTLCFGLVSAEIRVAGTTRFALVRSGGNRPPRDGNATAASRFPVVVVVGATYATPFVFGTRWFGLVAAGSSDGNRRDVPLADGNATAASCFPVVIVLAIAVVVIIVVGATHATPFGFGTTGIDAGGNAGTMWFGLVAAKIPDGNRRVAPLADSNATPASRVPPVVVAAAVRIAPGATHATPFAFGTTGIDAGVNAGTMCFSLVAAKIPDGNRRGAPLADGNSSTRCFILVPARSREGNRRGVVLGSGGDLSVAVRAATAGIVVGALVCGAPPTFVGTGPRGGACSLGAFVGVASIGNGTLICFSLARARIVEGNRRGVPWLVTPAAAIAGLPTAEGPLADGNDTPASRVPPVVIAAAVRIAPGAMHATPFAFGTTGIDAGVNAGTMCFSLVAAKIPDGNRRGAPLADGNSSTRCFILVPARSREGNRRGVVLGSGGDLSVAVRAATAGIVVGALVCGAPPTFVGTGPRGGACSLGAFVGVASIGNGTLICFSLARARIVEGNRRGVPWLVTPA
eukprot:CAMPEP_0168248812 /NCGR_PEP_ID=MMETSP0141_2-20121125/1662_1 /TAXON_ID=44445 /ORGANISM="Pseudo-nitzschia australis, Strain 10249 10 AB" /LENGTH=563 /DNA_ID=CAMNT_0008184753 /DNA_START=702 /DNA_END=2390 /DNA_ORIENTATION=-